MKNVPHVEDLELALTLAEAADLITSKWFQSDQLDVQTKEDMSPVTMADKATEEMIRGKLGLQRPNDTIVGEEMGGDAKAGRQWIIDPIDGTRNYMHGNPVYGTLIALQEEGVTVVAVVSAPQLGKRWWATKGGGAWDGDGRQLRVSSVTSLDKAYLSDSHIGRWRTIGKLDEFITLHDSCWYVRAFGDFWQHILVAEGAVDIAIDPTNLQIWDVVAPTLIVEEAGGQVTTVSGTKDFDGSIVSTNGILHDQVMSILNPTIK